MSLWNKTTHTTGRKWVALLILGGLLMSYVPETVLNKALALWQDMRVVDALWLGQRDSSVVDSFLPKYAQAAEVAIDTSINTTILRHQKSGKNVVCTTVEDCYVFYINSNNDVEYQKSTDGGASWPGVSTVIHAGTWLALAVWYDQWTPGDSGTLVHMVYFSATDDLVYAVFNTATDTFTSNVVVASTGVQGSLTNNNDVAVTKGTDGDLYVGTVDATAPTAPASFVHKCATTCTTAGNWTAAGANPWDGVGDDAVGEHDILLLPLSNTALHDAGDIMLVSYDITDGTTEYKIYDDSANAWSTNFTNIETATDSTTYRHTLGGTVDPATGDLYISYAHVPGTANTSEVRAWTYSDGWSQLTDPWANTIDGASIILDTNIAFGQDTDNLYVTYIRAGSTATANDVYYAVSDDGGSTWARDNLLSDGTDRDHRNVTINAIGDRLYAAWMGPPTTGTTLYGNTVHVPTVTVSATGTQASVLSLSTADQFVDGAFVFTHENSSSTLSAITITETGSVDAQAHLDNIRLFYDIDTSAPYDCASESYGGTEAQFGSTDTDGFSSANGTSTFSGSLSLNTTATACLYVVLDVGAASFGDTLNIEITDPSTDVSVGGAVIEPSTAVELPGTSTLGGLTLAQKHYHFRNDDGSETTATSATGGSEDTPLTNILKNDRIRLRIGLSNEGSSETNQYRLEYGLKSTTCDAISTWADVGTSGGAWDMSDSFNLTDGADTTDIAVSAGGVTDENTTFQSTNAGVKDTSNQTGNITLSSTQYTDVEYAIEALDGASFGTTYCFRLTDAGTPLVAYDTYPEVTLRPGSDFKVQRGVATIPGATTGVTITAGVDYDAPADAANAFIRLTNTQHTGAGHNVGGGTQNAFNVTARIADPENIETSVTFSRTGTTNTTRVAWEIVEYIGPPGGDNEIIVRHASSTTFVAASLAATSSVSGVVNDSDVVVFVTGQSNPDTGTADYNTGLVTSEWSSATNEAVFTRGEANADAISVSWAAVEFTGANWAIQRASHTYTNAGLVETESITPVNDLGRAFLHVQKRVGTNLPGVDEYGHEVWLSSVGALSFQLQSGATTPSGQTSVAWIIENTQTTGSPMLVTRSNGTQSAGAEPATVNVNIGATLSDLTNASIFTNNRTSGTGAAYPQPIMSMRLISTTQYELWLSDTGGTRTYRTEVVEWPTAVRTLSQNYYRFYVDNDALDPADAWPVGGTDLGENTTITATDLPPTQGDVLRVRMSVNVAGANLSASTTAFKLQFGERTTTCSAISAWQDVGAIGSTTALWRGYNTTPSDGAALTGNPPTGGALNLSVSDRAGTYEEQNISPGNPYKVFIGEDVEYDWIIENNDALDQTFYCFRMIEYDGTPLDIYNFYPTLITASYEIQSQNWRWYNDENHETPTVSLAAENVAPIDIQNENILKLRVTAREIAGKSGENVKLKLQFSEYSDFSQGVTDVLEVGDCLSNSLWCYADGVDSDNAVISSRVLTDSDACAGGVGNGCGTHNESGTTTSTFTHDSYSATEFEFTITHAGARANTVYFFRLYDVTNDRPATTTATYPSLVTEGATLSFNIGGLSAAVFTEGITTDVETTPIGVSFGALPLNTSRMAAQRLTVSTNATKGYKVFVFQRQGLLRTGNDEISPVTGTNEAPVGWATACDVGVNGCYGYHAGDDLLDGVDPVRFSANDRYAQFTTTPKEIAYNAGPVTNEATDIVYRVEVRGEQEAGEYSSNVVFLITPVF